MQNQARVGLILMRADWFGCGAAQPIQESIEADTRDLLDRLSSDFDIIGPWIVDTPASLQACQLALRSTELDMVLLAFQTWAEDVHLVSLLQSIGSRPLVLWCYLPWRRMPSPASYAEVMRGSGPVGAFGALGTLRNMEVPFLFTFGAPDDPRLLRDLREAGRAAAARQALRTARFGLVPSRNDRMQSSFVDEFRLMADFGPVVQYISVSEYKRAADSVDPARVAEYVALLRERYSIEGVPEETLQQAAQAALGLAHLAVEYRLDVVAVNDTVPDLLRAFHMRPALYPDLLEPLEVIFQPEGDLGAATANYILRHLTSSPTMFLEFWFWDQAKNQLVGGHAGLQNPRLSADKTWISPDYEYCRIHGRGPQPGSSGPQQGSSGPQPVVGGGQLEEQEGAQFQFIAHPGRVTLFQLRSTPKGWQAIVVSGMVLEGQPWVEAYPHAIIRLDSPVEHFLNRLADVGATQHWIMAYGSVLRELEAFCQMEKIPLEVITY